MSDFKIGTKVKDRYILKEFKGSGSFGEVWQAHDEILNSDVAIKIYISLDPRGVEEFKSEYITTQGISHPNLLTTTYFDAWEQHPFLVMKYCAKGSSTKLAGNIDEYALWQFIHDVSAGLKFLHELPEPIIHQDIKPDNILVDDTDHYLITDFGISKKIRSTMRKQSKRAVGAGATAYMGPERFESDPTPIKASDIWSLGVSIYELATGELPFSGLGGGMLRNGAEIPSFDKKWSKEMNMVMQSCLAKETWDRPTAQQLEEYSGAIIKGQTAEITWLNSIDKKENLPYASKIDTSSTCDNTGDTLVKTNKKTSWVIIASVVILATILISIVMINKTDISTKVPENSVETIDNTNINNVTIKDKVVVPLDNPEKAKSTKNSQDQTKSNTTQDEHKNEQQEAPKDENAVVLKKALANKDYKKLEYLANQCGYIPAFVPFAKYCLLQKDYENAEIFASAAVANGTPNMAKEAKVILETLRNLGYFD